MRNRKKKSGKLVQSRRTKRQKPTISIIGAGRLGTALGRALSAVGLSVEAVAANHGASARRAARVIGSNPRALAASQLDSLPDSKIILITTPDDVIGEVAEELGRLAKVSDKSSMVGAGGRMVLHASGALSSEVLAPLREAGFAVGSMHPLVSISDRASDADTFRNAFFCLEGDRTAVSAARSIVRRLGGQSFLLSSNNKPLYHAAAVLASGHVVALFDIANEMLVQCGLSQRRARAILIPLLRSTVANLSTRSPARALTGTFARGEAATARRHLAAISGHHLDDARAAYLLLGRRSLRLAEQSGMNPKALNEIAREIGSASD